MTPTMPESVLLRHLFLSPGHNFVGHYGKPAGSHPIIEKNLLHCVEGKGVVGDRFFGHEEDFKGQITFFAWEVHEAAKNTLNTEAKPPSAFRRNVITQGVDLNELIGKTFQLGSLVFAGTEECRPCFWMDSAVAPGAEAFLRGQGGLRARIRTGGELRKGPCSLHVFRSGTA